jgi:DNA-binding transcriptional ArsR family regulator
VPIGISQRNQWPVEAQPGQIVGRIERATGWPGDGQRGDVFVRHDQKAMLRFRIYQRPNSIIALVMKLNATTVAMSSTGTHTGSVPGGRLTRTDRDQIAAGMAEGLEYAEIARRLNRPTSTISREVARNIGPNGYRAGEATRSTHQRARRRKPSLPPGPPLDADSHRCEPTAARAFEAEFADMIANTGLSRMAARVLARLYLTDSGSLSASELVQSLRVSPASISKAVGYLEKLDLVRRERDARRRERYVVDDDFWLRAWSASARKNATWAVVTRRGAALLGPTTPAGARLEYLGQFFDRLYADMICGFTATTAGDALTVLAALVHVGRPLSGDELADALGWAPGRLEKALHGAWDRPDIADPVALSRTENGAYTVVARAERLTAAQRSSLNQTRSRSPR